MHFLTLVGRFSANRALCSFQPVYVGQFQPGLTATAFEAVGMQGFLSVGQGYLYFIVQNITFRTFVNLKSGVDDHIRVCRVQANYLVVNFVVEKFLVGILIFLEGLRPDQVTMSLFKVLFKRTIFAFV